MKRGSKSYLELRDYLDSVPVIDSHEHYAGNVKPIDNPLMRDIGGYLWSDLVSASFGFENEAMEALSQTNKPFAERFAMFELLYARASHTAYARGFRLGLQACWGIEEISLSAFQELESRTSERTQEFGDRLLDQFGIRAMISDVFWDVKKVIEGANTNYTSRARFALALPDLHHFRQHTDLFRLQDYLPHKITSFEEYLSAFDRFLQQALDFGIVCFKDQSAYRRTLSYELPARAEAERVFNDMLYRPRDTFGTNETRPLDDWMFQHFMRQARQSGRPVQLHTGHMARTRNDVRKANAAHLIPLLELHSETAFDLFHGNWPYMDEYLFIGKNYANAYLNLCWVQVIDPLYSVELMKRALMTVPHSKMIAYGGDCFSPELSIGYLIMARENTAYALSDMVDAGWIGMREAKQIGADWFFNNPNELYNLGFDRYDPKS